MMQQKTEVVELVPYDQEDEDDNDDGDKFQVPKTNSDL